MLKCVQPKFYTELKKYNSLRKKSFFDEIWFLLKPLFSTNRQTKKKKRNNHTSHAVLDESFETRTQYCSCRT